MKIFNSIFLLSAVLIFSSTTFARTPTPFPAAYNDGFVLVLWHTYSDDDLNRFLNQIKATGANSVTLPYFGCQSSITSSDVGACTLRSPGFSRKDASRLSEQSTTAIHLATLATEQGLHPKFLPIVATPQWEWRGFFNPTDIAGWFKSYESWIRPLAQLAAQLKMDDFIVGSELSLIYRNGAQWKTLLQNVRKDFSGPLVVAANWGDLNFDFWDEADAIGLSEYYPLTNSSAPTVSDLEQGAQNVKINLLLAAKKFHRPLYFAETGFPSTRNAAQAPWQILSTDLPSADTQSRCFDAFRKAWQFEKRLVNFSVWAAGDAVGDPSLDTGFSVFGKPAQTVLSQLFSSRATLTTAH